jgi:CHAD domain-containing protein
MKAIAPRNQSQAIKPAGLPRSVSPAPDCQAAFQTIAKSCVDAIRDYRETAVTGDPEAIHTMRIELTRLRAAVLFFSPMTRDDTWPEINKELRWLNSALGKARDHDVTAKYIQRRRYRQWAKSSRLAMLCAQRKVYRRLNKKLASHRYISLIDAVNHWVADGPWLRTGRSIRSEQVDAYAKARLQAWRVSISREGRHIRTLHLKQLHRLRIRCKRYRYVVAALHSFGVAIARPDMKFAEIAKRVHGALGDLRDLKRLRRFAQKRPPGYRKSKRKFIQRADNSFHREDAR